MFLHTSAFLSTKDVKGEDAIVELVVESGSKLSFVAKRTRRKY